MLIYIFYHDCFMNYVSIFWVSVVFPWCTMVWLIPLRFILLGVKILLESVIWWFLSVWKTLNITLNIAMLILSYLSRTPSTFMLDLTVSPLCSFCILLTDFSILLYLIFGIFTSDSCPSSLNLYSAVSNNAFKLTHCISVDKESACNAVWFLGREDPQEKE